MWGSLIIMCVYKSIIMILLFSCNLHVKYKSLFHYIFLRFKSFIMVLSVLHSKFKEKTNKTLVFSILSDNKSCSSYGTNLND